MTVTISARARYSLGQEFSKISALGQIFKFGSHSIAAAMLEAGPVMAQSSAYHGWIAVGTCSLMNLTRGTSATPYRTIDSGSPYSRH